MRRAYYTHFPRTILWLIPEGTLEIPGIEAAARHLDIEPFYLSKSPITNQQLEAFAPDHERSPRAPGDDDPALGVSFETARGYAAWYAEVSRKPMRLPTREEWLYAALGGAPEHPWGEGALDDHVWHAGTTPPGPVPPLTDKRANGFGLVAMLGAAWEWSEGSAGEPSLQGGSFDEAAAAIDPSRDAASDAHRLLPLCGFRIARGLRR